MSEATATTKKTEKVAGLFDAIRSGSSLQGNVAWYTPYIILRHLKSGIEYRYQSEDAVNFAPGLRYAMVIRVRSGRVWRVYESSTWNQEED